MQLSCAVLTLCVKEEDCFTQNGFSYRTEIKRDVKEEFFGAEVQGVDMWL